MEISGEASTEIKSPGQMKRHYSPNSSMRLNAADLRPGEALLGFGNTKGVLPSFGEHICFNLSESGDFCIVYFICQKIIAVLGNVASAFIGRFG